MREFSRDDGARASLLLIRHGVHQLAAMAAVHAQVDLSILPAPSAG
jgi:hypothetical protein